MKIEYGIMSTKWEIEADNMLTGIAVIVLSVPNAANAMVIYSPKDAPKFAFSDNLEARLDEIYGGEGCFEKYLESHKTEIRECYLTRKEL